MSNRFGPRTRLLGAGMNARVSQWCQRSLIESIQAGTVNVGSSVASNTAAITAVDTTRSVILHLGVSTNEVGPALVAASLRLDLTNSTTVTATHVTGAAGSSPTAAFVVIQFKPGVLKSLQRGTVTTAAGTAAITAVNTAKAYVNLCGYSTNADNNTTMPRLALTNATTVTITAGGTNGATASYEVWEWY